MYVFHYMNYTVKTLRLFAVGNYFFRFSTSLDSCLIYSQDYYYCFLTFLLATLNCIEAFQMLHNNDVAYTNTFFAKFILQKFEKFSQMDLKQKINQQDEAREELRVSSLQATLLELSIFHCGNRSKLQISNTAGKEKYE